MLEERERKKKQYISTLNTDGTVQQWPIEITMLIISLMVLSSSVYFLSFFLFPEEDLSLRQDLLQRREAGDELAEFVENIQPTPTAV